MERELRVCLLFPSLTVRSSGGFDGSLLFVFGILLRVVEAVDHTSGRVFRLECTVARDLDALVTGCAGESRLR
jgi:hypothetical protein